MRDDDPKNWVGRTKPALGSGVLTAEQREAKFQEYLAQERAAMDAGRPAPPTASWPIEKRRDLWMRRYPA